MPKDGHIKLLGWLLDLPVPPLEDCHSAAAFVSLMLSYVTSNRFGSASEISLENQAFASAADRIWALVLLQGACDEPCTAQGPSLASSVDKSGATSLQSKGTSPQEGAEHAMQSAAGRDTQTAEYSSNVGRCETSLLHNLPALGLLS